MTEQQLTSSNTSEPEPAGESSAYRDLSHPSRAEVLAAVVATEELNEADEVFAAERAGLETASDLPAVEPDDTAEVEADHTTEVEPGDTTEIEPDDTGEVEADDAADLDPDPTTEVGADDAAELEPEDTAEAEADDAAELEPEDTAEVEPDPTAIAAQAGAGDDEPVAEAPEPGAEAEPEPELEPTEALGSASPTEASATPAATPMITAAPPPAPAGLARPTPGRGPGPRPGGRRPSPVPPSAPHSAVVSAGPDPLLEASEPGRWGRVDSDGTVYVTTDDGERAVGFWAAGDPAAGLAHYGRRFDDFMTEVVILETRLAHRSGDAKATRTHAQLLRQSLDTLPAVGDLTSAAQRLDAVIAVGEQAVADAAVDRAAAKATAVARRETLCAEAEALAESTQWKPSGDRLKEIVDEWRTIRGIDRKTDDVLWKRFSKARDTFIRRRGSHFAELDKERGAAKGAKEQLIARAEALSESTDWAATATEFRNLMTEWKAAGRTSREVEDALWDRFRAAQEKFFARRQDTFASRDAEFEANAAAKEALLAEAEKINPARDLDAAKAAIRSIQDRWEAAGKVPRERIRALDARLRAVEDRVKSAEDSLWRKSDPETTARLAQFRSRYEAYQAQADKAKAAGDNTRAKAAQAQANQWLEWLRAAENAVD